VFAVEDTAVQLVWRDDAPGTVTVHGPAGTVTAPSDGGPGSTVVSGLPPGADSELEVVAADGSRERVRVRTLTPPPGPERFRFATISDLHLGEEAFGLLRTIREHPPPTQRHPERALRAALAELTAWGAQLLVVKGDITHTSAAASWAAFAAALADVDVPVVVMPGNHDTSHYHDRPPRRRPATLTAPAPDAPGHLRPGPHDRSDRATVRLDAYAAAARHNLTIVDPTTSTTVLDRPGVRLVVADTVLARGHPGTIRRAEPAVLDAAQAADGPVVVLLHHQLDAWPGPPYRPPGIPLTEADPFLRRLVAANPASLVSSGHTHRHRRHVRHGVVVTEVGSTKDYPGSWAGYVVHDGGVRQVVRRVARPDVLRWTDTTRRAALGAWGLWSPGRLGDRCFTHRWPAA
jgi:3',5'-cyclic-AMP phosphodiesterase